MYSEQNRFSDKPQKQYRRAGTIIIIPNLSIPALYLALFPRPMYSNSHSLQLLLLLVFIINTDQINRKPPVSCKLKGQDDIYGKAKGYSPPCSQLVSRAFFIPTDDDQDDASQSHHWGRAWPVNINALSLRHPSVHSVVASCCEQHKSTRTSP